MIKIVNFKSHSQKLIRVEKLHQPNKNNYFQNSSFDN